MSARGDDEIRADLAKRYDLGSRKGDWFERMARLADDVPGLLGQRDEALATLVAVKAQAELWRDSHFHPGPVPGLVPAVGECGEMLLDLLTERQASNTDASDVEAVDGRHLPAEAVADIAVLFQRERDEARAALAAALAWLNKADPYPDRNGDMFRELRAILAAAGAPEPPQEPQR